MKLTYTLTERDYYSALKGRGIAGGAVIALLLLFLPYLAINLGEAIIRMTQGIAPFDKIPIELFTNLAIFVFLLTLLPGPKIRRQVRRRQRSGELPLGLFGPHTATLMGDTLELDRGGALVKLSCWGLRRELSRGGMLICAGKNVIEFIPNTAFADKQAREAFCQALAAVAFKPSHGSEEDGAMWTLSYVWMQEEYLSVMALAHRVPILSRGFWTPWRILTTAISIFVVAQTARELFFMYTQPAFAVSVLFAPIIVLFVLGVLFLLNFQTFMGLPFFSRAITKRKIKQGKIPASTFAPQTVSISEQGITLRTDTGVGQYFWPQVTGCASRGAALVLMMDYKWMLPIASTAFQNDAQRLQIEAYIQGNASRKSKQSAG